MTAARRCPVCGEPVDGAWCFRCAADLSSAPATEPETPALVRGYVLTTMAPPPLPSGPEIVEDIPHPRPDATRGLTEAGAPDPLGQPPMVTTAGPDANGRRANQRPSGAVRTVLMAAMPVGLLALLLVAVFMFEPGTRDQRSLGQNTPIPTDLVGSQLVAPPTGVTPTGSPTPSPTVSATPSTYPQPSRPPSAPGTSHGPVMPPPPTTTHPTINPPSSVCTAGYQTTNSWPGGFQGQVTVTAGSAAVNGWTVRWSLEAGQAITQIWNGTLRTTGSSVSVSNLSYNSALQPATSTTFGFLANGTPSAVTPTCTSP